MQISKRVFIFPLLLLTTLPTTPLTAQITAQDFGNHEKGIFCRLYVGVGVGSFVNKPLYGNEKIRFSGDSLWSNNPTQLKAQIGAVIVTNGAIHGSFTQLRANNYGLFTIGLGISYYFMPLNFYISPEYHLNGRAEAEERGTSVRGTPENRYYTYQSGKGFGITIGREWRATPQLGFGLALIYDHDRFKGDTIQVDDEGYGHSPILENGDSAEYRYIGIALSVTYN